MNPGKPSGAKKIFRRKLEPVLSNQAPARQRNQKTQVRKAHLPHCSCCSAKPARSSFDSFSCPCAPRFAPAPAPSSSSAIFYDAANEVQRRQLIRFVTRLACADTPEVERERAAYIHSRTARHYSF